MAGSDNMVASISTLIFVERAIVCGNVNAALYAPSEGCSCNKMSCTQLAAVNVPWLHDEGPEML